VSVKNICVFVDDVLTECSMVSWFPSPVNEEMKSYCSLHFTVTLFKLYHTFA